MESQPSNSLPMAGAGADSMVSGSNGQDGELLTSRMQYYEQELMRSISAIVKNVSEYFQLANGTVNSPEVIAAASNASASFWSRQTVPLVNNSTPPELVPHSTSEHSGLGQFSALFGHVTLDDVFTQFILLIALAFFLWVVNRRFLRWGTLATVTEVLLSWAILLLASPLVLLLLGPILLVRTMVHVYLRLRFSQQRHIILANPFETVWSFEAPNSPSTCIAFYIIEGDGNLERLRADLHRRAILRQVDGIFVNDCFRRVLRTVLGFIAWERVEHFDIKNHIRHMADRARSPQRKDPNQLWSEQDVFDELEAVHEASLRDLHQELGLPEAIPPWEILVVPKLAYDGGARDGRNYYGVIFRAHHSIMDGVSLGNLLHDCMADRPFKFSVDPIAPLRIPLLTRWLGHTLAIVQLPRITFRNLFFFEENAFHGQSLTGPKKFGWSRPLRMDTLKQVKTITKSSVFAVLLSSIGGSLQRLYAKRAPGKVPKLVHACPPVAILPYPNRYPRNRFSIVLYPVALGAKTALERLAKVFSESKSLATSPDVLSNYYVVYVLGMLPYPILNVLAPLAHATFTFSNIPGPAEPVQIFGGDKLVEIGAWIPIKNRIGIGTALFSYEDRVRVTFIADKAALAEPDDVSLFRDGFEDEISDLTLSLQLKCDKLFIE